jgi:hypothetical protein
MVRTTIDVGVFVERRTVVNPWTDHVWRPHVVLPGAPTAPPWTVLHETPKGTRYYAGSFQLELFSTDTASYRDNLRSGRPSLWVSLRPTVASPGVALQAVTADPAEGEALTEPGTDIIDALPMHPAIQAGLAAFVAAHHVERPFIKRQRDRAAPEAMGRRPRSDWGGGA